MGDNEPSDYSGMAIVETFTAENFNIDCDDLNEEWLSEHPELMTCQDAFNFIFNTASGTFVPNGDGVFQDDYIFNAIDVSAFNPEVFANGGFIEWVQTQCYECGGESVYCHTLTVRIFENEIEVKVDPQ